MKIDSVLITCVRKAELTMYESFVTRDTEKVSLSLLTGLILEKIYDERFVETKQTVRIKWVSVQRDKRGSTVTDLEQSVFHPGGLYNI